MTTRIDHSDCTHSRTPKGRAYCRDMRRQAIKTAQIAYDALWKVEGVPGEQHDEYAALVDDVHYRLGVTLREAYDIVEKGPIIR